MTPRTRWQQVGPALTTFIVVTAISVYLQYHYWSAYGFPIFPATREILMVIVLAGMFGGVFLVAWVITHFWYAPRSPYPYNPVAVGILMFVFLFMFFEFFFWYWPLGQKWEYAKVLDRAEQMLSANDPTQKITVHYLHTRDMSTRNSSTPGPYEHIFMVKNHLNEPVRAQVLITVYNRQNERVEGQMSSIIPLQPGEFQLVTTEETILESSVWNRRSFSTNQRIAGFDYIFRIWD